jgi:membrane fusion protein (multidrug efflux system)
MRSIYSLAFTAIIIITAIGCGASGKDKKGDLNDKKTKLQELKQQQSKLTEDIKKLESEITKMDPNALPPKPKLVTTMALNAATFRHYIDLQGTITTENVSWVTPRGMGGQVRAIYVKEGQPVRKGQVVVKLDDAIMRQQIEQAKIQLNYLEDIYRRRQNLWDQNIGTEVELVTARNNVSNQQKQIDLLNEQLAMTSVRAEVSGIAETVNIRVGETLTPQTASMAGIKIVNTSDLRATVDVPENYASRVKRGTPVIIELQDINKKFNSTISLISQSISATTRGFTAEAKVPSGAGLKPNQVAMVRILDYVGNDALSVPVNTIQTDEKGKFVMVAATENGKKIARKKPVVIGELYNDNIEIKSGLQPGDEIITDGYQNLYEGQLLTTTTNS